MKIRRALAAGAGVFSAVAIGIALESDNPARALGPPADGTYTYNEAGVSGASWTISALCDQPSGTRNMNDYSDPIVFAMQCALNIVSSTSEQISAADKLQNFSGRARMSSMLWSFKVDKADGVSCPGGGTAPSTETFAFSDETMSGTHTTMHGAVCGMEPTMKKTPFSLQLAGPPPSPVQRYPLYCNGIAMCY
ncbi:hypothetical protein [Mycobacterium montefiorense]|uniref:Uncharacterized protein n=1 Tax=Mycobacterium montefiorense TaxID=154654 RepID=A0AA37PQ72_9MYCO|nr:hypothetical protein [Mycobacterium montefiorense]GBG36201.1 hypothetical protein MmonteBS_05730 [Mycobacterium montefiorense]GKU33030.1 hypothetical protein NJB14191_03770 [Mycobacterium montefiorense]GKU38500.1 hypothetical protein NJB14192_04980 [Mycobacterium montefiorense]GKU46734.1 hypothetical protein NJB14194_33520 [Mycobacterium montefiorense]GKU51494.1 hypothetical protein NJB14195_27400 [Mycobacterium montefiorense]